MRRQLVLGAMAAATLLAAVSPALADKRHSVPQVDVDALVLPDGRAAFVETIVYDYRGSFRYATRDIPLAPGQSVDRFEVAEAGVPYAPGDGEEPGTFRVERKPDSVRVTWYYRARDERRAFTLSYTFTGAVTRGPEVAQFYHQFVGDEWDRTIGAVTARLRFSEPVAASELRAWAHGPLYGAVRIEPDGSVRFDVAPLPRRTFFEGRAVFPPAAVPGLAASADGPRLDAILAEEGRWADEANRARAQAREVAARRRPALIIGSVLAALGLAGSFALFRRSAWPHAVTPTQAPGECPSDRPPALVARLVHGTVDARALGATIADLARRGHLSIVEDRADVSWHHSTPHYWVRLAPRTSDRLVPFESDLLDFLRRLGSSGQELDLADLPGAARRSGERITSWFSGWKALVDETDAGHAAFEPRPTGAIAANLGIAALLFTTAAVLIAWARAPAPALPALIGGVVVAVFTVAFRRRTLEGQREFDAWKAWAARVKQEAKAGLAPRFAPGEWGTRVRAGDRARGLERVRHARRPPAARAGRRLLRLVRGGDRGRRRVR